MKRIVSLILCLLMTLSCVSFASAEDTTAPVMPFRDLDAATITKEMGLGWNLGNTFDAHTAFTPDAVTFANQITKVEAYRPEKGFCDGVKGLCLSGAKVLIPDAVMVWSVAE